jgi:hypothetical protein
MPADDRRVVHTPAMSDVWIDVQMWTALRGNFHPYLEIECDVPDGGPAADDVDAWRERAVATLTRVADADGWQSGRYHYTVERRDPAGRVLEVFVQGVLDLETPDNI